MSTSIPGKTLQAAREKLHVATAGSILFAMAENGLRFEDVDRVLNWPNGATKRTVRQLADGKDVKTYVLSDLAQALHRDALIGFMPRNAPAPRPL